MYDIKIVGDTILYEGEPVAVLVRHANPSTRERFRVWLNSISPRARADVPLKQENKNDA